MLWYVLQTRTGEEEKLVGLIRRMVPGNLYGECFVIYQEQLWRRQEKNLVQVKRAFPGYVFITSKEPEALFFYLKQVPAMSKMMADDTYSFLFVEREEEEFLKQIMDENHIIGLSYLETDRKGKIRRVSGPLENCVSQIERCRLGKRHVLVRLKLLGKEKTVLLGIVLDEDICRELKFGKVEAPIQVPERYMPAEIPGKEKLGEKKGKVEKDRREKDRRVKGRRVKGRGEKNSEEKNREEKGSGFPDLSVGDRIAVASGVFAGMTGVVYEVKNHAVKMGIRLFGQDMEIELPVEGLRKISGISGRGFI